MIFSDGRVNAVSWATDRPGGFSLEAAKALGEKTAEVIAVRSWIHPHEVFRDGSA
jgi:hypothetical protein